MCLLSAVVTIAQSSSLNTPIINVTATDNDEINTPNSDVVFQLLDTNLPFQIDRISGLLSTRSIQPALAAQNYTVIVVAMDLGNPPLSSSGIIIVDVAPPNFYAPQFPSDLAFSIMENDNSTELLFEFEVTDDDIGSTGDVRLTLLPSQYSENFTLTNRGLGLNNGRLGGIFYRGGPGFDREQLSNFTLSVRATDQGNPLFRNSTDAILYVTVEDENDNSPIFEDSPYATMVSENAGVGSVIATIEVTDADEGSNANITYSFDDFSGDEFIINEFTGNVIVNGILLVSNQEFFQITVTASDGVFDVSTYINITVLEVNDNRPQFIPLPPPYVSLPENTQVGTLVLNISVSDVDTGLNGNTVLSILQENRGVFTRNSYPEHNEFYLTLNSSLDFEVSKLTW